jgi:hypothetical protein
MVSPRTRAYAIATLAQHTTLRFDSEESMMQAMQVPWLAPHMSKIHVTFTPQDLAPSTISYHQHIHDLAAVRHFVDRKPPITSLCITAHIYHSRYNLNMAMSESFLQRPYIYRALPLESAAVYVHVKKSGERKRKRWDELHATADKLASDASTILRWSRKPLTTAVANNLAKTVLMSDAMGGVQLGFGSNRLGVTDLRGHRSASTKTGKRKRVIEEIEPEEEDA